MDPPLTPELVLQAYQAGFFPMANEHGRIHWYSPDPRCVFPLDRFHVPRSVRQSIRRATFDVRVDSAFDEVIACCADRPEGTWISAEIVAVYSQLHQRGHAHSVESWHHGRLAGGLYGVAQGGAFFGESMFTRVTGASKVALVSLVEGLRRRGYVLLDTQFSTPHLERFGAVEISRRTYLRHLRHALTLPCQFADS